MANDAKAVYMVSNATIFPVVTGAAFGSVGHPCFVDVCVHRQRRQENWYVKGSVAQTWTQQRLIEFLVAHVSFVGDLVSVVQSNAQLFQQTSIFVWT